MSWLYANEMLDIRLKACAAVGSTVISWPNEPRPSQSAMYVAVHFLPATVEPELTGGDHEKGTYQVSVFVPSMQGTGAGLALGQAIIDWFKRQNLSGVSCGVPFMTPPIQSADWWHIPVSIPFIVL